MNPKGKTKREPPSGVRVPLETIRQLKRIKDDTGISQTQSVSRLVQFISECPTELRELILGRLQGGLRRYAVDVGKAYLDQLVNLPAPVLGFANDPRSAKKGKGL